MSSQVTLKEIADELGISAMTVSRAINNKSNVDERTRKRVLDKAKSMGYTPNHVAKSLVSRKTYTIGVIIPEISHSFFPDVVRGIEEVTYQFNYQLFLTHAHEQFSREKKAINTLRAKRVDGLLVSSSQTVEDFSFYKQVIDAGLPFVFFDRCVEGIGASCVSVNDVASSKRIVEHLIAEHKYQDIAYLSGPQKVTIGRKRLEGYKEAMNKHNLPIKDEWIVQSDFMEEGGYNAMQQLLALPAENRPRAVAAVNDPAAFGAIEAIKEEGLSIPDDIAIVGFTDDIRAGLMESPLTTIRQPGYRVGKRGAEKLIESIEQEDAPIENIEIETELIVRESCGCTND